MLSLQYNNKTITTMDRYQTRFREKITLINNIKADIKDMLIELGYGNYGGYATFSYTCKPTRFTKVGVMHSTLFFVDNDNNEWHSDNVNDIDELLNILRAMHHILPK
jgi:hypothetical protein